MKPSIKIISAVLALLCAAALTSCGNKTEDVPVVVSGETSAVSGELISGETTAPVTEDEETEAAAYDIIWVNAYNEIVDTNTEISAESTPSAEYPHLTPLTDEARFWIHHDYAKPFKWDKKVTAYDVRIVYYYGTYDSGEVVVLIPAYSHKNEKNFSVAGYDFNLSSESYKMVLHTDSSFIPLDEAYESGYLSDSDIKEIHYHAENSDITQPYLKLKAPANILLTDEAEQKLRKDCAKFRHGSDMGADNIDVVYYYGTYDSGEVVVMCGFLEPIAHFEKYFSVAGYEFYLYTCSFDIMLHTDSTFIEINEAYESGLLSDKDMMEINYYSKHLRFLNPQYQETYAYAHDQDAYRYRKYLSQRYGVEFIS